MKVVTQRMNHLTQPFQFDCKSCGSTLETEQGEGRFEGSQKDGDAYVFICPVCAKDNWIAASVVKEKTKVRAHQPPCNGAT
jgi:hypothetical protein